MKAPKLHKIDNDFYHVTWDGEKIGKVERKRGQYVVSLINDKGIHLIAPDLPGVAVLLNSTNWRSILDKNPLYPNF